MHSAVERTPLTNSKIFLMADDEDHKIRNKKINELLEEKRETKNQVEKRTNYVNVMQMEKQCKRRKSLRRVSLHLLVFNPNQGGIFCSSFCGRGLDLKLLWPAPPPPPPPPSATLLFSETR